MATELTEQDLIDKIAVIDGEIAKITSVLGTPGAGAVQFVDYQMGNKTVDGSTRLKQLMDARKTYQDLLASVPKVVTSDHGYDVDPLTGKDKTEYIGDEG